jgi:voltage-gated potassium channel
MKSLTILASYLTAPTRRHNARLLVKLIGVFWLLVAVFSIAFHGLMHLEGREYSWVTSVYWTLVTMTTVGFGDITFHSDLGRIFSVVVLLSGAVFLLVLLPFTFVQFVFVPWMQQRDAERAPRELPIDTRGHVILTALGPIEDALIARAGRVGVPYVILVDDREEASRLYDRGYRVMVGPLDDPTTYRAARVENAVAVVTTRADTTNTNITFTVEEITQRVPIVATARDPAAVDILALAGADEIIQLGVTLGRAMAQRVLGTDARSHVLGEIVGLEIAEAGVARSRLVGKTLGEANLGRVGIRVGGLWNRGRFEPACPEARIEASTALILAGTAEQFAAYDREVAAACDMARPVVVIGGGRVGRQVAASLGEAGIAYKVVEKLAERVRDPARYVVGDAAELEVLSAAGIREASAVVITTHDDDVNVYLVIYARRLRPDIEIIARANLDRNVSTLYRAGADAVLSYAAIGSAAIWNRFRANDTLFVAEGLDVFRMPVPADRVGRPLEQWDVRASTGCGLLAVARHGRVIDDIDRHSPLSADAEVILVGDASKLGKPGTTR